MRLVLITGCMLMVGCGNSSVESLEKWPTFDVNQAPIAAADALLPPTEGEMIAGRFGPVSSDTTITSVWVGQAPGWGCAAPDALLVAAWGQAKPMPAGYPMIEAASVIERMDLGNGFEMARMELQFPAYLSAGEQGFVALSLASPDTCGVTTAGPDERRAWRLRSGAWSQEENKRFMMIAEGSE